MIQTLQNRSEIDLKSVEKFENFLDIIEDGRQTCQNKLNKKSTRLSQLNEKNSSGGEIEVFFDILDDHR